MKHIELPITLWNGKFLDGTLTITTQEIPEGDENDTIPRNVYVVLIPQSSDLTYTVSTQICNTEDSLRELLNSITYEYVELVMIFKNRELENGAIRMH